MEIQNACVVFSMRKLLGDANWGPEEVLNLISKYDGLPSEENTILEEYAPVRVWSPATLEWSDDLFFRIFDGETRREVLPFEKVIISYMITENRAHMECIIMQDFLKYTNKTFLCFITKEVY